MVCVVAKYDAVLSGTADTRRIEKAAVDKGSRKIEEDRRFRVDK